MQKRFSYEITINLAENTWNTVAYTFATIGYTSEEVTSDSGGQPAKTPKLQVAGCLR